VDLKKLAPGEIVTVISGALLLVFSFFSWYGYDFGPFSVSRNGWQSPGALWSLLAILLGVVLAAHVIVEKLSAIDLPERLGSVGWGVMHLAGGALAFIFVIIKATSSDGLDRKIGLWVGLLASLGLLVGGYLMAKEAGELPTQLGGKGGGATPPPAA
jgi:hypothetical protein